MRRPRLCWLGLHRMRPTVELVYPAGLTAWRVWRCLDCRHETVRPADSRPPLRRPPGLA